MDVSEFKSKILKILPGVYPAAIRNWISYAMGPEQEEDLLLEDFFDEVYIEFRLVKSHEGEDIARRLFDSAQIFMLESSEIREAAHFLKGGMAVEAICQKAVDASAIKHTGTERNSRSRTFSKRRHGCRGDLPKGC